MTENIRFIDLFGGIGGFRHGLEQASDKYKCVDYIEYDKYAVKSYNAIFQEQHNPRDVTELNTDQIPEHDLLCAGFPCQSFSVAGNRQGTDEARGKLFREIVRIAEAKEPEMLLLENVKGILSQKAVKDGEAVEGTKGHAFREVLEALHELGYCLEWQVLNSKHWGVPQNRERVFIIGHLGEEPRQKVFPITREDREDLEEDERSLDTVHPNRPEIGQADRVYENDGLLPALNGGWTPQIQLEHEKTMEIKEIGSMYDAQSGGIYSRNGLSPTVQYGKRGPQPHHVLEEGLNTTEDDASFCIDSNYMKGTSPGDIGSGRRTHIVQRNQRDDYYIKDESGAVHESMSNNQAPKVLNPEMHSTDAVHHPEGIMSTVRAKAGGKTQGIGILQIPRGQNDGGIHCTCPTVSSNSWHENNFLKKVQPCLTPGRVEKRQNGRRMKEDNDQMFTLTGQDIHGVTENKKRIRKLTPKECWRLQGFPDKSFERAEQVNSDTQLYKQAGNAVSVPVIEALGQELLHYFN